MLDKKRESINNTSNIPDRKLVRKFTLNNLIYLFIIISAIYLISENMLNVVSESLNMQIIRNRVLLVFRFGIIILNFLIFFFFLTTSLTLFSSNSKGYMGNKVFLGILAGIFSLAVILLRFSTKYFRGTNLAFLSSIATIIYNVVFFAAIFKVFFRRSNKRLKKIIISIALFSAILLSKESTLTSLLYIMALVFAIDLLDNSDYKYISVFAIIILLVEDILFLHVIDGALVYSTIFALIYFGICYSLKRNDKKNNREIYTNKEKKSGRVIDKTLDRYNSKKYSGFDIFKVNIVSNYITFGIIVLAIIGIIILVSMNIYNIQGVAYTLGRMFSLEFLDSSNYVHGSIGANILEVIMRAITFLILIYTLFVGIVRRHKVDRRYISYVLLLSYLVIAPGVYTGYNVVNIAIIYTISLTAVDRLIHNRDYDIDPVSYMKSNIFTDFDRLLNNDPINKTKLTTKNRERKHKKVVFGITSLGIGGAERVLVDILKEMQNIYDITVYTIYGNGALEEELKNTNITQKTLFKKSQNEYGRFRRFFNILFFNIFKKIIYVIQIRDIYDVEIAFLEGPITRMFGFSSLARKIAWVHSDIENFYDSNNYKKLKIMKDRMYYDNYDVIVFVSNMLKENFKKFFPENSSSKVLIYNYIDEKRIIRKSKESEALEISDVGPNLVTVARIVEQKALFRFLSVHKRLLQDNILHNVYIIGDGPLKDQLVQEVRKEGVKDTFKVLGEKKNPYPYISKADYFCLLSYSEGYGIVLDEAKILRKPIILTNTAAVEAAKNYDMAYILENNEDAIYEGLKKILRGGKKKRKKKKGISYSVLNSNKIYSIISIIDGKEEGTNL